MPRSKWFMGILTCLMLAGGVFCWLKEENEAPPQPLRASAETEAFFAVREETAPAETAPEETAADWIWATEPLIVNINTADEKELERLPGIGPAKAAAIVAYRKQHGPFGAPEELMRVPGIKAATFAKLEAYVTV